MTKKPQPKTIHRPDYARLTALLRDHRARAGLSQLDMSAALGRSQSYISDIECGKRRIDLLQLADICDVLGMSLSRFVREFENP